MMVSASMAQWWVEVQVVERTRRACAPDLGQESRSESEGLGWGDPSYARK